MNTTPLSQQSLNEPQPPSAWYRNIWVWFIIALPLTVVAASMVTIVIAYNNAPTLINTTAADTPNQSTVK